MYYVLVPIVLCNDRYLDVGRATFLYENSKKL